MCSGHLLEFADRQAARVGYKYNGTVSCNPSMGEGLTSEGSAESIESMLQSHESICFVAVRQSSIRLQLWLVCKSTSKPELFSLTSVSTRPICCTEDWDRDSGVVRCKQLRRLPGILRRQCQSSLSVLAEWLSFSQDGCSTTAFSFTNLSIIKGK